MTGALSWAEHLCSGCLLHAAPGRPSIVGVPFHGKVGLHLWQVVLLYCTFHKSGGGAPQTLFDWLCPRCTGGVQKTGWRAAVALVRGGRAPDKRCVAPKPSAAVGGNTPQVIIMKLSLDFSLSLLIRKLIVYNHLKWVFFLCFFFPQRIITSLGTKAFHVGSLHSHGK